MGRPKVKETMAARWLIGYGAGAAHINASNFGSNMDIDR
jgi:hypothetical protein